MILLDQSSFVSSEYHSVLMTAISLKPVWCAEFGQELEAPNDDAR